MILITGGLGFLGCNLARQLCDAGNEVLLTAHRKSAAPPLIAPFLGTSLEIVPTDITRRDHVDHLFSNRRIDAVVHAAARSEKGDTQLYEAIDVNVTGTGNVLEAARRAGIRRVLFISSEAVYQGMADTVPFKELEQVFITSDRFVPGTKKAAEIICLMYARHYDMEAVSVRLTRTFGPLYTGVRSVPGHMLQRAAQHQPLELGRQDPLEAHDFIYAKDAARAIVMLLKAPALRHRIYNLGSGKLTAIGEFAAAIRRALPELDVRVGEQPPLVSGKTPMDINAAVDITRLREEVGFSPEFDADRIVSHYLGWARDGSY